MRLAIFLLLLSASRLLGVDYLKEIKPILQERCFACHGALKQNAKLRLDSGQAIHQGGVSGEIILSGKSKESLLIARLIDADPEKRMPPEGLPLKPEQIKLLRDWIDAGAKFPDDDRPEPNPKDHWAFQPPQRSEIPSGEWGRNPIDRFLAKTWQERKLKPQAPAEKRLLLRRVYLDLTGLPPTGEEIQAFLDDASTDAYERLVDRLLESPRYGERWGRHFMDIWRYSDWWGLGSEVRNSQKHIWHWRDWIVESLNRDLGYDEMIRQMLAADELYPGDPTKVRATGFLARQYFIFNRTTWLDETVEHTSKAFLGLTMNCTKCHDHKYDPISHTDYYRFRAIFEPYQVRIDMIPGEGDFEKNGIPRAFDCNLEIDTFRHQRGDDRQPIKEQKITPGIPKIFDVELKIEPVKLPLEVSNPTLQPFVETTYRELAKSRIEAAKIELVRVRTQNLPENESPLSISIAMKQVEIAELELPAIEARFAAERARGTMNFKRLATEAARIEKQIAHAKAEESLLKAELELVKSPEAKRPEIQKKVEAARLIVIAAKKAIDEPGENYTVPRGSLKTKESNIETDASRFKPFPPKSTGRRTALANWIADRSNPLTARVIVNHLWLRHFGQPLVGTVFDFGRKGAKPTHPELLDWLAVELMEHHWSLKHLHRLMVTSEAYRLSSSAEKEMVLTQGTDPENRYLWRMNSKRMEAQAIRDSLLHLAGQLDSTFGGPSLSVASQGDSRRRSLYFFHSHNEHHKFLMQFDDAGVLECYRRTESIVPQQALTLANSRFSLQMCEQIESRFTSRDDDALIREAFQLLLGSDPSGEEIAACRDALTEWQTVLKEQKHPNPTGKARANLIAAIINHNDFVTVR